MKYVHYVTCTAILLFLSAGGIQAQDKEREEAAVRSTVLDYLEGWYDGDVERMDRALHPDLVKRIVYTDPRAGRSIPAPGRRSTSAG